MGFFAARDAGALVERFPLRFCAHLLSRQALRAVGVREAVLPSETQSVLRALYAKIARDPTYKLEPDEAAAVEKTGTADLIERFRKSGAGRQQLRRRLLDFFYVRDEFKAHRRELRKIWQKILANREYYLSQSELETLAKIADADPVKLLTEIREISNSLGPTLRSLYWLERHSPKLYWFVVSMGFGLVFLEENIVHPDEKSARAGPGQDEFELIYLSPSAHPYIRIGDTIYSYGPAYIYKFDYSRFDRINDNPMFGSSTRIRFRVSQAEVAGLQSFLESEVGALYLYLPMYTSCVSAAHRAIERNTSITIPAGLDRSPALSKSWFKFRKLMGDKRIEDISFYARTSAVKDKLIDAAATLPDLLVMTLMVQEHALAAQLDHLALSTHEFAGSQK